MWRRVSLRFTKLSRHFSSSSSPDSGIPTLYSFLQPTIFAALRKQPSSHPRLIPKRRPEPSLQQSPQPSPQELEQSLLSADRSPDDAWRSFKSLVSLSHPVSPLAADALVSQLVSVPDRLSLKRALAAVLHLLDKSPNYPPLSSNSLQSLLQCLCSANAFSPALTLMKSALKNRFYPSFETWGPVLIQLAKNSSNGFYAFMNLFELNCGIAVEEKIQEMKPDLGSCNEVLDGCCRILGSVGDAEKVFELISKLGLAPDLNSFASLAYLYANKGMKSRIEEIDQLMDSLGFTDKRMLFRNLVSGYSKLGNFELVSATILRSLKEECKGDEGVFCDETYLEVVKSFIENGRLKDLASLVIETQELESGKKFSGVDSYVGYGIINACIGMGWLDKAHIILDEMNVLGASVGLGVYSSILKAYCKEHRTAEAAQLVSEICAAGHQLDVGSYDALIDAAMSTQDFQSAFSLFRDMRQAGLPELKTSYITIMTGLMETHRPELMAAFLDSVVDDPRVEVATHDWNSIIHAYCKAGRLEDARRTYRRMLFLRFEPNSQTYLSLINGYLSLEKYFSVLLLWTEVRRKGVIKFEHDLVDAFLYSLVKGGFFDAAMQVVEKAQELKIYINKWRHKQAFMETHKKLKVAKLRRRNARKMEALIAFRNWAGLNA